jgi:hypothetical protein
MPKGDTMEGNDVRTTIVIPARLWRVLRALAEDRALAGRGRPNASGVLRELLEAEAKRRQEHKAGDA